VSQALLTVDVYKMIGTAAGLEISKKLVRLIGACASELVTRRGSGEDGEFVEVVRLSPLTGCSS
jgi:hypothetical protein